MSISPASSLNAAFARFDKASETLQRAVSGDPEADAGQAIAEQIEAKVQVRATIATVRFADEMMQALIDINRHR